MSSQNDDIPSQDTRNTAVNGSEDHTNRVAAAGPTAQAAPHHATTMVTATTATPTMGSTSTDATTNTATDSFIASPSDRTSASTPADQTSTTVDADTAEATATAAAAAAAAAVANGALTTPNPDAPGGVNIVTDTAEVEAAVEAAAAVVAVAAAANFHRQDTDMDPSSLADSAGNACHDAINGMEDDNATDAVALAAMQEAAAIMLAPGEQDNAGYAGAKRTGGANSATPRKRQRTTPARLSWEDRIVQLSSYKQEHGNLLIPIRYKINPSLGKFVHNTREQYKLFHQLSPAGYQKKCSLTAERIAQLDELGFVWNTQRAKHQETEWQSRFEQLVKYKQANDHCLVPHGYPADPSFAEWVHRQRTTFAHWKKKQDKLAAQKEKTTAANAISNSAKKKKEQQALSDERIAHRMQQLTELGFRFTVHSDKWMDHWHDLKAYKSKHGNCLVPTHFSPNPRLGRWVHTQRHQRRLWAKLQKSSMTQERQDLLDQLGFAWEVRSPLERPRATWQQRFEELQLHYRQHKHFIVDPDQQPQLHAWAYEQRQRLKWLERHGQIPIHERAAEVAAGRVAGHNGSQVSQLVPPTPAESTLDHMLRRMGTERIEALASIDFTSTATLHDQTPSKVQLAPDTGDTKDVHGIATRDILIATGNSESATRAVPHGRSESTMHISQAAASYPRAQKQDNSATQLNVNSQLDEMAAAAAEAAVAIIEKESLEVPGRRGRVLHENEAEV